MALGLSGGLVSPPPAGVQFEVRRVELQGPATLFCCWLVKDLLHSRLDSALRSHLLLASLPSSAHSTCELSAASLGEVRVCGWCLLSTCPSCQHPCPPGRERLCGSPHCRPASVRCEPHVGFQVFMCSVCTVGPG